MSDNLRTFEELEISSWLVDGMLRRPAAVVIQASRKVALGLAALALAGVASATTVPVPQNWRPPDAPARLQQAATVPLEQLERRYQARVLTTSLTRVRALGPMDSPTGSPPLYKAVRTARLIANQITASSSPQIGINGDGNVFLHFVKGGSHAYLTVEAKSLHLLCIYPGRPNITIDDEKFVGKRLSTRIKELLADF